MITTDFFENYASRLQAVISGYNWEPVSKLASALKTAWREKRRVFICGNGGSAGNAIHLANDFLHSFGIPLYFTKTNIINFLIRVIGRGINL